MQLEDKLKTLPEQPGVYMMKDKDGEIIYIGKAVVLKNRVRSYFQSSRNHSPKVVSMVKHIADLNYIVTDTELEALILECNLIKKHKPKYNILLKDDKHYPYLKITLKEDYPRIIIARSINKDGAKYFGPYANTSAVYETLKLIKRLFSLRTCGKQFKEGKERACLNYHIKRCPGPCIGAISKDDYRSVVKKICLFLEGRQDEVLREIKKQMEQAAEKLEFEKAAKLRDQLKAVETVIEKQKIISASMEDRDVIAIVRDKDTACAQVFFIRNGKLLGQNHFILSGIDSEKDSELMESFMTQYYLDSPEVPGEILLQHEVDEIEILEKWLTAKRGKKVNLTIPKRGEKVSFIDMAVKNAVIHLEQLRMQHQQEKRSTEGAVSELREYLHLENLPHRIEAFDISNIQGTETVASMVVFEGGKAKNSDYRRFKIKTVEGPNDFASMREVVTRRYSKPEKLPDLILIDGGKGQLGMARDVLYELNLEHIPTIGLAKEFEEVFMEGNPDPIIIPRDSQALYLLQRIRDEAHRFAITYHRKLRDKKQIKSALDEIPSIGPKRKKALLKRFGSVKNIKTASIDDLAAVDGMNRKAAEEIAEYFNEN